MVQVLKKVFQQLSGAPRYKEEYSTEKTSSDAATTPLSHHDSLTSFTTVDSSFMSENPLEDSRSSVISSPDIPHLKNCSSTESEETNLRMDPPASINPYHQTDENDIIWLPNSTLDDRRLDMEPNNSPPKCPLLEDAFRQLEKEETNQNRNASMKTTSVKKLQKKLELPDHDDGLLVPSLPAIPQSSNEKTESKTPPRTPVRSIDTITHTPEQAHDVNTTRKPFSSPQQNRWQVPSSDEPLKRKKDVAPSLRKRTESWSSQLNISPDDTRERQQKAREFPSSDKADSLSVRRRSLRRKTSAKASRAPERRIVRSFSLPRRCLRNSSSGLGSFLLPGRNRSINSTSKLTVKELNIFCSDMVSTDFILAQIEDAKQNPDIVKLEIEDFFCHSRTEIATALKDLITFDQRPWERLHFVDEVAVHDASASLPVQPHKNPAIRELRRLCKLKVIPTSFCTKLTISNAPGADMVKVLRQVQKNKNIIVLNFTTSDITIEIIEELTRLFQCDNRKWDSVYLNLSGIGPFDPGTMEHNFWCETMETCSIEMRRVAEERGILMH